MNDKSAEGCFCEQAYCDVCEKMGPRAGKRIAHLAEQSDNYRHFPVLPIGLLGELLLANTWLRFNPFVLVENTENSNSVSEGGVLGCGDHEKYEY